jgi:uncharacterized protein (TIGR02246 family)
MATVNISVEDRLLIAELMARYAFAIDLEDAEGYANNFTSDALLGMRTDRFHGHEEIKKHCREVWFGEKGTLHKRLHFNPQHVITEADGDSATVRSYSLIVERQSDEYRPIRVFGQYRDKVVKVDGRWLFRERIYEEWDPERKAEYKLES